MYSHHGITNSRNDYTLAKHWKYQIDTEGSSSFCVYFYPDPDAYDHAVVQWKCFEIFNFHKPCGIFPTPPVLPLLPLGYFPHIPCADYIS